MKLICLFFVINCLLCPMSADDIFEGLFRQGRACFRVRKTPSSCNATLADSFQPDNPSPGINKPDTKVYLFTPNNPDEAELLHECGGRLPLGTTYDDEANTEIFVHGYIDGVCRSAWMRESKDLLMRRSGRYNVILVDWTWGNLPDYKQAGENCITVGEQIGFVINNIMNQRGVGPEKFHIVGHSFGAIAAGFAGRRVPGLRRITGLDPALAPFKFAPPDQRLTYRDARIVDIIHTNGGKCFGFVAGDERQLGHADFYPNGGTIQLSCYYALLVYFLTGDFVAGLGSLALPLLCYHIQSTLYYKVSINPDGCPFTGVDSPSYQDFLSGPRSPNGNRTTAIMGMDYENSHRENGERLKFFLKTALTCPYVDYSHLEPEEFPPTCKARKN